LQKFNAFKRVILSFLTLMFLTSSALFAITDKEMGIIINLAGKQRMLTQKMSKDALLIAEGIDVEKNKKDLESSMKLFEKTLNGLMHGDKELRLAKTNSKSIQTQLRKVQKLWEDFKKDLQEILKGNTSREVLLNISRKNVPLLKNMHKAVTMFVEQSGNLSKLKIDIANDINIAGRQRMLTQKMSKELLLIDLGIEPEKNKKELKKTINLFDRSLKALLYGDKEIGSKGCKLNNIKQQLLIVKGYWDQIKPTLNEEKYSKKRLKAITDALALTLKEMDKAVKMYEQSIKRQIKISKISQIVNSFEKAISQNDKLINEAYLQQARTQKMVKEIILTIMGVEPEKHLENLKESSLQFDKTLKAFINGDEKAGIPKITDKIARKQLSEIDKEWQPFYENVKKFLSGKIDRDALLYVLNNNEKLLRKTNAFTLRVQRIMQEDSSIGTYTAHKVALVQRERYLLQKMAKERLLIEGNIDPKENRKKLNGSILIFSNILKGDKNFGSLEAETPKAKAHLERVRKFWSKLKPKFQQKSRLSDAQLLYIIKNTPVMDENLKKLAYLLKNDID